MERIDKEILRAILGGISGWVFSFVGKWGDDPKARAMANRERKRAQTEGRMRNAIQRI